MSDVAVQVQVTLSERKAEFCRRLAMGHNPSRASELAGYVPTHGPKLLRDKAVVAVLRAGHANLGRVLDHIRSKETVENG